MPWNPKDTTCGTPDTHVFGDGVPPTTRLRGLYGATALESLAAAGGAALLQACVRAVP